MREANVSRRHVHLQLANPVLGLQEDWQVKGGREQANQNASPKITSQTFLTHLSRNQVDRALDTGKRHHIACWTNLHVLQAGLAHLCNGAGQ